MNNHYVVTQNIICTANNTTEMHFFRAPFLKIILCFDNKKAIDVSWNVSSRVSFILAAKTLLFFLPACQKKVLAWHLKLLCLQEASAPKVCPCFWHRYFNEMCPSLFWALSESKTRTIIVEGQVSLGKALLLKERNCFWSVLEYAIKKKSNSCLKTLSKCVCMCNTF